MNKYDDIINLPRHISKNHKPMPISNRAAIFAPFSALTGYNETIIEASRITDRKIEISDEEKEKINDKLQYIKNIITQKPLVSIKYFIHDSKKSGGKYIQINCNIKKIDTIKKIIILTDNTKINIEDIIYIDCL